VSAGDASGGEETLSPLGFLDALAARHLQALNNPILEHHGRPLLPAAFYQELITERYGWLNFYATGQCSYMLGGTELSGVCDAVYSVTLRCAWSEAGCRDEIEMYEEAISQAEKR